MWDRTGIREFHKSYSLETKPFSLMSVVKMTFGDGTLSSSLRCSRMRHEIPFSPSAQRLPKACSDTPCMDTRIFVSISDWLVSYAPYNWSYSCKISKYKYCHVYFVFLFKARPCFAFEKVEKAMSDSSVYCNLCSRVIEKINERVLLSKRWKQFDVVSEIESLEISLRSTENKYVCRNCVAKLKKRRSLFEHTEKLEAELKSLSTSEDSLALKRSGELRRSRCSNIDYFDVLFVSNRDRWHFQVVHMPNLVFHHRSQRRYDKENTRTTRLFEQSIRSDQKALENQRFAVACSANLQKYFDLQEIHGARFPVQVEDLNAFCHHSSVVADMLFPTQSRFDV